MKIAILGAGHMGAWLIDILRSSHDLAVFDTDLSKTRNIRILQILEEPSEVSAFSPDLVINAVSLQNTVPAFKSVIPFLPQDCILADVASVKGPIPDFYRESPFRFVSVHPMFGPTFANVDLLSDENVILIKESHAEGVRFFRQLFQDLGLHIFDYSFAEHDQMIAYSLTLPFASTMVFAACMDNTAVPGTTFRKHLEIAKGLLSEDEFLLAEILFNPFSLAQLVKVTSRLDFLKHVIRARDFEEAQRFFESLRDNIR
jgi:prephenate dehydrogenase